MGNFISYTAQNCDTFDYKSEIRGIQIKRLNDKINELENIISKQGDDLNNKYNELLDILKDKDDRQKRIDNKLSDIIKINDLKIE